GHQVLLDYRQLALILWGAVHDIQKTYRRSPWGCLAPLLGLLFAGVFVFFAVQVFTHARVPMPGIVLLIVGFVGGAGLAAGLRPKPAQIAAEVRAKYLRRLLDGK